MSNVFDLAKIKKLIKDKHPAAVIIVDTNIIMREPEFKNWKTSLKGPLFVLSDVTIIELEQIKRKPDSRERASKAIESLNALFTSGRIAEGISLENIGWFVIVPSPLEDNLKVELNQLGAIVEAFGQSDTKFLLLTKELSQCFPDIPIVVATADRNMFNILEANAIPSYLSLGSPMLGIEDVIEDVAKEKALKPVNWDSVLADVQKTTQDKSAEVELTLTAKRRLPKWPSQDTVAKEYEPLAIADGFGIVRGHNTGTLRFLWSVLFKPVEWKLSSQESFPSETNDIPLPKIQPDELPWIAYIDTTHLDSLKDAQNIIKKLTEALANKISECRDPVAYIEDMPTVQDPISVMQELLLLDYVSKRDELISNNMVRTLREEIKDSGGLLNFWGEWILNRQDDDGDTQIILGELLMAIRSCWRIGDTVKFRLVLDI